VADKKDKPVLDERTFEKLLEAGYVLQEHNRKMRELEKSLESQSEQLREQDLQLQASRQKIKKPSQESARPSGDYVLTLAEIVEAQHQIQMRHLDLEKALALVAERVMRITGAAGSGIGILEGATVRYRAGAGSPALPVGTEVPLKSAVCQANIRTGQVIRTDEIDTEFLFDPEPCRARGILSLVAVPIYQDGNIIGALELYFDRPRGYAEQDIHTCQLMAGLVTEAIGRDADSKEKTSMAAERTTMLAEIERLQPAAGSSGASSPAAASSPVASSTNKTPCWKCGHNLMPDEQFCGTCGAPRSNESVPGSLQSKVASAWHMSSHDPLASSAHPSSAADAKPGVPGSPAPQRPVPEAPDTEDAFPWLQPQDDFFTEPSAEDFSMADATPSELSVEAKEAETSSTALAKTEQGGMVWGSAAKARDFLEGISSDRAPGMLARFWKARRGDISLAVAVILVIVVIRWGIWSNRPVGAHGRSTSIATRTDRGNSSTSAPDANLSAFDKLLIALGLADAPETPENMGNPDVQVWVDTKTAQYYCPGADLYGKTPKGKMTSQRDAQLDHFEPAYRKPCE